MSELKISFCESLAFRYYVKPRSWVRSPRENMQIWQPRTTPWISVIELQFWPLNNMIFYIELHYLPDQSVLKPHFAFLLASSRRPSWREAILVRTFNHTATLGLASMSYLDTMLKKFGILGFWIIWDLERETQPVSNHPSHYTEEDSGPHHASLPLCSIPWLPHATVIPPFLQFPPTPSFPPNCLYLFVVFVFHYLCLVLARSQLLIIPTFNYCTL